MVWQSNVESSATGDPKASPATVEQTAPTPVGCGDVLGHAPDETLKILIEINVPSPKQ
jgi:hypothetical protein